MGSVFYEDIDREYLRERCKKVDSEKMLDRVLREAEDAKGQAS